MSSDREMVVSILERNDSPALRVMFWEDLAGLDQDVADLLLKECPWVDGLRGRIAEVASPEGSALQMQMLRVLAELKQWGFSDDIRVTNPYMRICGDDDEVPDKPAGSWAYVRGTLCYMPLVEATRPHRWKLDIWRAHCGGRIFSTAEPMAKTIEDALVSFITNEGGVLLADLGYYIDEGGLWMGRDPRF